MSCMGRGAYAETCSWMGQQVRNQQSPRAGMLDEGQIIEIVSLRQMPERRDISHTQQMCGTTQTTLPPLPRCY